MVNFQIIPLNENSILTKLGFVAIALQQMYEFNGCLIKRSNCFLRLNQP